jgi:hypothetical protein
MLPAITVLLPAETGLLQAENQMLPAETGLLPAENQMLPAKTELLPAENEFLSAETGNLASTLDDRGAHMACPCRNSQLNCNFKKKSR